MARKSHFCSSVDGNFGSQILSVTDIDNRLARLCPTVTCHVIDKLVQFGLGPSHMNQILIRQWLQWQSMSEMNDSTAGQNWNNWDARLPQCSSETLPLPDALRLNLGLRNNIIHHNHHHNNHVHHHQCVNVNDNCVFNQSVLMQGIQRATRHTSSVVAANVLGTMMPSILDLERTGMMILTQPYWISGQHHITHTFWNCVLPWGILMKHILKVSF